MNILIVDDREENLYLLETLLKKSGYRVQSAADGAQALEKLRADSFDMIISDVLMPMMDGFQLCREVKGDSALRDIPFVFCTATYTDEKDEEFAYKIGADKYIQKPIDTNKLLKIVQGVKERGRVRGKKPTLKEEREVFKLYSERLVKKLEKRTLDLKESEEKFRSLAEQSPNMIFINKGGRVVYANKRCEEIMGYKKEKIRSPDFDFLSLIAPESREPVKANFSEHMKGKDIPPCEYTLITKRGKKIHTIHTTKLIRYGGESAILGIITDITERKKAEEKLKESEKEYRNLVDNALVGVYKTNLKGDILYVNDALSRMLGYESAEVTGSGVLSKYKNPKDRKVLIEKLKKMGNVDNFELEILTKTGKTKNVLLSATLEGDVISGMIRDITERKRVEEALKQSEKRVRNTLNSLALGVSLINRDMNIVWLNETFRKWFPNIDVERRPICYKSFYLPPKEEVCSYCPTIKTFEDGKVHSAESGVCADGNIYLITSAPILDKEGKTTLVIETVLDITERKIIEGTIRESEERYRDLFDNVNDGIVTIDTAGDITYFNEGFADTVGYPAEELVGKNIVDLIHQEDREFVLERHKRRQMGEDVPSIYGFRGLKKNGEIVYVEANVSLIRAGNRTLGSRVIMRDITERKRAEEALRESEEKYRMLFDNASDAIFIADTDTENLLFANKMAEKLTGRSKKELIGMHRLKLHSKEKSAHYKKQFREHVHSGGAIDDEAEVERKDGTTVPVLISASVFEIGGKKIIQGIFRDITERKRAEDELLRKFLRYRVEKGEVYLIKEGQPDLSIEVFKDMLNCGFSGTVFSRAKKEEIKEVFGNVRSFWFADSSKAKDAIEPRFSAIESKIKAIGTGNTAVLIDRMDYLISKNGFDAALKFVQRLFEQAYLRKLIVMLALDPKTLKPTELRRLEKETKRVEPKIKSRLPADLYEILKFVYSENKMGGHPSYKDIHDKFKITRTTARSRIKKLKGMKFLVDRKRGRTKILEITGEGQEQF